MVNQKLFSRHAAKAIVTVEQIRRAAVVIENVRGARQRFDPATAFLAVEAIADRGEDRLAVAFAANPTTDA